MRIAAATALLLLLTACSPAGGEGPAATPMPAREARATPEEIVADAHAQLVDVKVRRTSDGLHVAAWWRVGNAEDGAITESEDGFATARVRRWTRAWYAAKTRPLDIPGFERLVTWPAISMVPGERAVVGGGDGATLFPFGKVARSNDGGPWTTYDVARGNDLVAYTSGQVVLPDGRLLALLGQWSDDRNGHPSDRAHGLYVSAGDDWSDYAPAHAEFDPALTPAPRGWSPLESLQAAAGHGGVVWTTTSDARVYASIDGARTFREISVR